MITVENALKCKKGGLILIHHNDVAYEWGAVWAAALTPKVVYQKPIINHGRRSAGRRRGQPYETLVGQDWKEEI